MKLLIIGEREFQQHVGSVLARLFFDIDTAVDEEAIKYKLKWEDIDIVAFDDDLFYSTDRPKHLEVMKALKESKRDYIIVSSQKDFSSILEAKKNGAVDYIIRPYNQREFILRFNAVVQKKTRVACLGGGTGLFTLLLGLKTIPDVLLTSVVTMSDDGGSSGKISQAFGILPPGDIRRSLVALSNAPELMNQIMQHRFEKKGEFQGHSFGNIFLTVLAEVTGSMSEAVRALSDILNIQGIVLPASRTQTRLVARFEDGTVVKGESNIDLGIGRRLDLRIADLWHEPEAQGDPDAYSSIINANVVTLGPGDLFTSVGANLIIKDIRDALQKTPAQKVYICNLMTKPGETSKFKAVDHLREIIKYLGGDYLDFVLLSDSKLSNEAITEYAKKNQSPVVPGDIHEIRKLTKAQIIAADIGNETELVRHDSLKLKDEIQRIIQRVSK